jgi:hypothetical protein
MTHYYQEGRGDSFYPGDHEVVTSQPEDAEEMHERMAYRPKQNFMQGPKTPTDNVKKITRKLRPTKMRTANYADVNNSDGMAQERGQISHNDQETLASKNASATVMSRNDEYEHAARYDSGLDGNKKKQFLPGFNNSHNRDAVSFHSSMFVTVFFGRCPTTRGRTRFTTRTTSTQRQRCSSTQSVSRLSTRLTVA